MNRSVCGHVPMPGSGAYGHWYCQRRRWHLGRHRSNNYTLWLIRDREKLLEALARPKLASKPLVGGDPGRLRPLTSGDPGRVA